MWSAHRLFGLELSGLRWPASIPTSSGRMPGLCSSKPACLLLIHERPDGWLQSQAQPIKYSGSRPRLWSRITSCSLFLAVGWLLRGWSPWDLSPMSSRAPLVWCTLYAFPSHFQEIQVCRWSYLECVSYSQKQYKSPTDILENIYLKIQNTTG